MWQCSMYKEKMSSFKTGLPVPYLRQCAASWHGAHTQLWTCCVTCVHVGIGPLVLCSFACGTTESHQILASCREITT